MVASVAGKSILLAEGPTQLFVGDYEAFEQVLADAHTHIPMRTLAYCVMPNHWHLVLWPRHDRDLSRFMAWLTLTHTQRWHAHHHSAGSGHLYQGRFKSFPVQADEHFLTVCRYVERNALRAGLMVRAEEWRRSSLWRRISGPRQSTPWLGDWPVPHPRSWVDWVNERQTAGELDALQTCLSRGQPFGNAPWVQRTAHRLCLAGTLQPRGRPRKGEKKCS